MVNPGIYFKENDIYYTESAELNRHTKEYKVSRLRDNETLIELLMKFNTGITSADIIKRVTEAIDCTTEEASEFIKELVSNKILIPLTDYFVNKNNIAGQLHQLEKIGAHSAPLSLLNTILDNPAISETAILSAIQQLHEYEFPFKIDLYRHTDNNLISKDILKRIKKALYVLLRIKEKEYSLLEDFKIQFERTFGNKEVDLLTLLFEENNLTIGPVPLNNTTEHTARTFFSKRQKEEADYIKTTSSEKRKLNLLLDALTEDKYVIELTEDIITKRLETKFDKKLSDSFSVQFRLFKENGIEKIFLEKAGGNSAIDVLSRFSGISEKIDTSVSNIFSSEKKRNKDKIIAQVIHFPDSSACNIVSRVTIADYIIPCFDVPYDYDPDKIILLSDLTISLKNNRLILYSKKLQKEIVTKNYCAYDYAASKLPVFHLLSIFQEQDTITSIGFDWGRLARKSGFLPRMEYDGIVLSTATWRIAVKELLSLIAQSNNTINEQVISEFTNFRKLKKIPAHVVLVDEGDQELFIDFENLQLLHLFFSEIKNRSFIYLKEFLPFHKSGLIENGDYVNQFIASFVRTDAITQSPAFPDTIENRIVRNEKDIFHPGSEWLYFKVYMDEKNTDSVLLNDLYPLICELKTDRLIDSWFFIRYDDPKSHVRIRLHLNDEKNMQQVTEIFYTTLSAHSQAGIISQILIDTYERETERYFPNNIANSEHLFFRDSKNSCQLLQQCKGSGKLKTRLALAYVDFILQCFEISLPEKMKLVKEMLSYMEEEFIVNDKKNLRLYKQQHSQSLYLAIDKQETVIPENDQAEYKIVAKKITELFAGDDEKLYSVIRSYIHMTVNRIFHTDQRINEIFLYDILNNYYQAAYNKKRVREAEVLSVKTINV
jgi:thiopeptide-type bacteriocin biosynthesis protein